MRTELMMEHFALPYDEIKNPIEASDKIMKIAIENTALYEELFLIEPSNSIKTFN
jgi:hypothetical protein